MIGGLVITVLGTLPIAFFAQMPSVVIVALSCFIIGLGMGAAVTPAVIAAQSSVPWNERGVVTGTNMFARSIGSAVGVAIFGAIANSVLVASGGSEQDPAVVIAVSAAVFVAVVVSALATLAAAAAMPATPVVKVAPEDETVVEPA